MAATLQLFACLLIIASSVRAQTPTRIAVLDFTQNATAARVIAEIRRAFTLPTIRDEFLLVDSDLAGFAARGAGYRGSLNLTTQEARDLGAAIGADFYFIGAAETVPRSPSSGPAYYESYASVFLVSGRTGNLVLWQRPLERAEEPDKSEKSLLRRLASAETREAYYIAIRQAIGNERALRAQAANAALPVIEVMSDSENNIDVGITPPRPYRRLKPAYPDSAAIAEVEAVVDVLADIDEGGEVTRVEMARWAGYGLDESVIDTVRQMHFFPATRNGRSIPMRVLLRYNFRKPPPAQPHR